MALDEVLSRCVAKWQGEGIRLAPAIAEADLRRLWASLGRVASEDVVRLYATVGGFEGYGTDDDLLWTLWTGDMIREENHSRRGEGVIFCDHSLGVIHWELREEGDRTSSVWQITDGYQAAPSVESFFRLYLEDPWRLIMPWIPPDGKPRPERLR